LFVVSAKQGLCVPTRFKKSDFILDFVDTLINVEKMKMPRKVLVSMLLLLCIDLSVAQTVDSARVREGIARKMYAGAMKSLAWYDIPIATVDLAELLFKPSENSSRRPIKFPPTNFDKELDSHVGVHGTQTIVGRAGEVGAAALLGTRLLVNIGADLAGADVTSEDYHHTFWFYKSIVYTHSVTMLAKYLVYRMRPDGSDSQSFFSDHSSIAFCTASYLSLELSDWYDHWKTTRTNDVLRSTLKIGSGICLYAGATYVAYARLHDEKHYLSDVVVGAGVGTIVGTLMYHWHWDSDSSEHESLSFFVVDKTPTVFYTLHF
jgi:membrane-associated phospholipid phosphatase